MLHSVKAKTELVRELRLGHVQAFANAFNIYGWRNSDFVPVTCTFCVVPGLFKTLHDLLKSFAAHIFSDLLAKSVFTNFVTFSLAQI